MRFGNKTAAGIDISQDRISIVLLKNGKNGPELVRSAVAPMPEGAVKDGNIADAVLLSKAIRELKRRNRMLRTKRAAVSLFAKPVVVQIIDMPKQVPSNIRQFVHNEVRNCVALPSRDIALDFCGIGSAKAGSTAPTRGCLRLRLRAPGWSSLHGYAAGPVLASSRLNHPCLRICGPFTHRKWSARAGAMCL